MSEPLPGTLTVGDILDAKLVLETLLREVYGSGSDMTRAASNLIEDMTARYLRD